MKEFIETYKGEIKEVVIGSEGKSLTVGGENTLPYHFFEGSIPNPPLLALEVWDKEPENWPDYLLKIYSDVLSSPLDWANKCINNYNADLISFYLASTDSDSFDVYSIALKVKELAKNISVPLIVNGIGDKDKDSASLTEIAKVCAGEKLLLGPVVKENYEEIGAAALEYGHSIIVQTPLDINLAKELNVKLSKFFPREKIVIDPLSSALGYGLDYTFSIMERIKQVAVVHGDELMKMPMIANIGKECWKTKEAKESEKQGILWESITGLTYILSGSNIVIMNHPESVKLIKNFLK